MGAILRATNTLWLPGNKPGGAPIIDWSNPLTDDLSDYLLFNDDGIPNNLASPSIVTGSTSNPALVSTAMGAARYCTGGSDINIPNHVNYAGAFEFTVRVLFLPVTWPANFTVLLDKGTPGGGRELSLFFDTAGNIDFWGIGGASSADSIATGVTAGSIWDLVWARPPSGANARFSVNGKFVGTANAPGGVTAVNSILSFGANPTGGGQVPDAKYILVSIWLRQLSDDEIAYLYLNPFSMLTTVDGELPQLNPLPPPPPTFGILGLAACDW